MVSDKDLELLKEIDWWKSSTTVMPRFYHLAALSRVCQALLDDFSELESELAELKLELEILKSGVGVGTGKARTSSRKC